MNKILYVVFVSLLLALVAACGEQETSGNEPTTEETKPKKEEKKDNRTVAEKLEEDNNDVDKAELNENTLTLEKEVTSMWDETSIIKHDVYDLFEAMNKGFKEKDANQVNIVLTTAMTDEKGNEEVIPVVEYSYSRESFESLNYDNFTNMAYSEAWRILNESDSYKIHPGIYQNLKAEYKRNLSISK